MTDQLQGLQLAPQQKRLWLVQQDSSMYVAQATLSIIGKLDVTTLQAALQHVVDRHEILRTTFHRTPGITIPIQVILDGSSPVWGMTDVSDVSSVEQEAQIEQLRRAARAVPFDVERGPLVRAHLVTRSGAWHSLVISLPSLCADAWTLQNLVAELRQFYAVCLQGADAESDVATNVVQYADFSAWQHGLLESEDAEDGRRYWRAQRCAAGAVLTLPFERQVAEDAPFEPASLTTTLDSDTLSQLRAYAQSQRTSLASVALACWQTLLWRVTSQNDIVVGMVFDGRRDEGLHAGFGLFAKSIPLHVSFADAADVSDVVRQVDKSISTAVEWQDYFLEADEETQQPVVSVPFSFTFDEQPAAYDAPDVSFALAERLSYLERFTVQLACERQGATLVTRWDYDAQRLAPASVRRLGAAFQTLLRGLLEQPDTPLARLPLLSSDERTELVETFNATVSAAPSAATLHQLFEAQAARTPAATAVVGGSSALCYADLNAQANQLARHLQTLGVGPEVLVGVLLPRTPALLVALLGILKAGGAYVPLEHGAPAARLALTLGDAGVRVIVTDTRLSAELPPCTATLVTLDTVVLAQQPAHNLDVEVRAAQLAYVLYTSGSTGHPKGVMIAHQGLVNYLSWAVQAYDVVSGTGTLVHSPLSFDLTVTSLFGPLLCGRTSVLLPEEQELEALAAQLQVGGNYSLVKLTPAHLAVLAQTVTPGQVAGSARALIIGGEALHGEALAFWQTHAPATRLVNEYGPTETVVGCCVYEVGAERRAGPVPIGRPIANTQLYVLDEEQQPVPLGVTGELYIGGVQLARGYLGQAALTAAAFVPDSFSATPGARLYRTGDLVRYLPESDGILQFLGRNDHQVKLRGFRIELEEIEAVLRQHPAIREAVAVAREEMPGDKRLVAYLVMNPGNAPDANELHRFMSAKLPWYMLPSDYLALDALPLTPNGKTDRRGLPAPERARPILKAAYVAPYTPIEQILAAVWGEVLTRERIGVHDSFFALGGDSIMSIRVVALARERGLSFSVQQLFEHQTIAELAEKLEQAMGLPAAVDKVTTETGGEEALAQLLEDLEGLSADDVRQQLRNAIS